jgi:hypothetical protein
MNAIAKVLVPNKCWIVEEQGSKLGTLNKEKKGYSFFRKGDKTELPNIKDVKEIFGPDLFSNILEHSKPVDKEDLKSIYEYPCSSKPFNPVYNIKKKLPIYAKSSKSKSLYCAGHYIIKFRKGWVKSFCPKLITLERYPYQGPFKTENEMKNVLNSVNKNE